MTIRWSAVLLAVLSITAMPRLYAQGRGVYTVGAYAVGSGVMPEPGLTIGSTFLDYSFDELRSASGAIVKTGSDADFINFNSLEWVSDKKILGANYALVAVVALSNSSISSPQLGAIAGGGGFSDSFYQPLTLGWHFERADIQAAYGFFAPTGRFTPGATNNTGTGFWTNCPIAGETFYLTEDKRTSISAYQLYEFHTTQQGTHFHPGQTFNLDYSLMQIVPLQKNMSRLLQFGLVGYVQRQTTDNSGPGVNPDVPGHYKVNALGAAANVLLPASKVSVGFKLYKEFSNSSSVQGYSVQIAGGVTF